MTIKFKWLILVGIILVGFGLRVYQLERNPVSMYWDEAAMAYDADAVVQTGLDMHGNRWYQAIFPSYGDYKLPLYIWFTALTMKILGPTVTALRLVSAMAGMMLIVVGYFLGKNLFKSEDVGIGAAAVLAFSPWAIHFSRVAFEANLAVTFIALTGLCLYLSLRQPSGQILAAICAALSIYAYFSARGVLPGIYLGFYICFFKDFKNKSYWLWAIASIMVFVSLLIPIYRSPYYEASNQFRLSTESLLNTDNHIIDQNINRELNGNTLVSRFIYHRDWFLIKRWLTNMGTMVDWRYLFFEGETNPRHGTGRVGLFLLPMIALLWVGWLTGMKRHTKIMIFLTIWWLAALLPASIPLTVPHALRSLNALPALALIIGYGGVVMIKSQHRLAKVIFIGLLLWSIMEFARYWHDYWHHYPLRSATAWQYGYEPAARYLGQNQFNGRQIYVMPLDRMYLYFLFFNRISPSLIQGQTKAFQITDFDRYHFTSITRELVEAVKPGDILLTESREVLTLYQIKLIKTITDMAGQPLYQIYEKSE